MKTRILALLVLSITFFSCEKVIDLDLNEAEKALVIEAKMYDDSNELTVNITETTSFYNENEAPGVVNAQVTMRDDLGTVYAFANNQDGTFSAVDFEPQNGRTYTLAVLHENTSYEATASLPEHLPLDSISYEYDDAPLFGDPGYVVYCEVEDPAAIKNFYRVIITVNGEAQNTGADLFLFDDQYTDGNRIVIPLFSESFSPNDVIKMDMLTMDEKVYNYLEGVSELAGGGGQSAAPANPVSNWDNGALGYFGAYTRSSKTVTLPAQP